MTFHLPPDRFPLLILGLDEIQYDSGGFHRFSERVPGEWDVPDRWVPHLDSMERFLSTLSTDKVPPEWRASQDFVEPACEYDSELYQFISTEETVKIAFVKRLCEERGDLWPSATDAFLNDSFEDWSYTDPSKPLVYPDDFPLSKYDSPPIEAAR